MKTIVLKLSILVSLIGCGAGGNNKPSNTSINVTNTNTQNDNSNNGTTCKVDCSLGADGTVTASHTCNGVIMSQEEFTFVPPECQQTTSTTLPGA